MGEIQKEKIGDLSTMSVTSRHTLGPQLTSFIGYTEYYGQSNLIGPNCDSSQNSYLTADSENTVNKHTSIKLNSSLDNTSNLKKLQ